MKLDKSLMSVQCEVYDLFLGFSTGITRLIYGCFVLLSTIALTYYIWATLSEYVWNGCESSLTIVPKSSIVLPEIYICPTTKIRRDILERKPDLVKHTLFLTKLFDCRKNFVGFNSQEEAMLWVPIYSLFTFSLPSNHFCRLNLLIILTLIYDSEMRMVIIFVTFC